MNVASSPKRGKGADEHTSNRLPVLAADIRRAHAGVKKAAEVAAEHTIEAGRALIEAKALSSMASGCLG